MELYSNPLVSFVKPPAFLPYSSSSPSGLVNTSVSILHLSLLPFSAGVRPAVITSGIMMAAAATWTTAKEALL